MKRKKMVMKSLNTLVVGVFFSLVSLLGAQDLPVFYRATFSPRALRKGIADWATHIDVRYGGGSSCEGHDSGQHTKPLFSAFGPVSITNLGLGLESTFVQTTPMNPSKTYTYWGIVNADPANPIKEGRFLDLDLNCSCDDGKVDISADFQVREAAVTIRQCLFSGFFIEVYSPLRGVKIDRASYKVRGNQFVTAQHNPSNAPTLTNPISLDDFISNDLPDILAENGFCDPTKQRFSKTGFTEILLSAGWEGYDDQSFSVIDSAAGSVQVGAVIPVGGLRNENKLFSIPLGYNDHWGAFARLRGEVALFNYLKVGVHADVDILFPSNRCIRMRTDMNQSGWIVLGKGKAKVDTGTVWGIGGYVKGQHPICGLSGMIGYSFFKQENTGLHVEDCDFLKTVLTNGLANTFLGENRPRFINKDCIVNGDARYDGWDQHVVHLSMTYDVSVYTDHWFAPRVMVEYNHHVVGRRVFITNMIAGTLGASITWRF